MELKKIEFGKLYNFIHLQANYYLFILKCVNRIIIRYRYAFYAVE